MLFKLELQNFKDSFSIFLLIVLVHKSKIWKYFTKKGKILIIFTRTQVVQRQFI